MNRSLCMSNSISRAQAGRRTLLRQCVSACACGGTCKRRRSLLPRRPRLSKNRESSSGPQPYRASIESGGVYAGFATISSEVSLPPEKKLLPCSFRARKCEAFQRKLCWVHHSLKRRSRLSETRRRRSLLPRRPVPGRLRQVPVPMRIMVLEAGYVLLPSTSRPISLPSAL